MRVRGTDQVPGPLATAVRESEVETHTSIRASGRNMPRWEADGALANEAWLASVAEHCDRPRFHSSPQHRAVARRQVCSDAGARFGECAKHDNRIRSRGVFDRTAQPAGIFRRNSIADIGKRKPVVGRWWAVLKELRRVCQSESDRICGRPGFDGWGPQQEGSSI